MLEGLQHAELDVLWWIRDVFGCDFLDWLMPLITSLGNSGSFLFLLTAALLCTKRYRRMGLMVGLSLLLELFIVNLTLKPLVGRLRPFQVDEGISLLIGPPGDASFPSGHTASFFGGATVLMMQDRRLGIPMLVLAVLVGFSRLYLQVHFPSDVLFGILLGIFNGFLSVKIVDQSLPVH